MPKYDQHFITDEHICRKIVQLAEIGRADVVLEIGAGRGSITRWIPECKQAFACEIDKQLADDLAKRFKKIRILNANGLEVIRKIAFDVLISSVPYSITEPLMQALLTTRFKKAVLVLPKRFVQSIINKDSLMGLIASSFLNVEQQDIERSCFEPAPSVDSVIAILTPKKEDSVLRQVWLQRDKKLKNALREAFVRLKGMTKKQAEAELEKLGIRKDALSKLVAKLSHDELSQILSN